VTRLEAQDWLDRYELSEKRKAHQLKGSLTHGGEALTHWQPMEAPMKERLILFVAGLACAGTALGLMLLTV
jgi:hypothetical protein